MKAGLSHKPVILLIPGCCSTSKDWPRSFINTIHDHGFQTIAIDIRDNGKNNWNTDQLYTLDDMASDVLHLLSAYRIRHAHIIGMSMGGAIAQLVAIKEPEKVSSLALLMSTSVRGIWDKSMPPPSQRVLDSIEKEYIYYMNGEICEGLKLRYNTLAFPEKISDREINERIRRMMRHGFNPFSRHVHAFQTSPSRTRDFSNILCGTTIIHGTHDELFRKEHAYNLYENLLNSSLHFVESGHFISENTGSKVANIIIDNISEVPKGLE
tara:strand:+ start:51 stop:851 length:801 start_codon:yes stop_codon:yes gene_type:complete